MIKDRKYSISDIAFHNEEVGYFYFSKVTLKCFGQIKGSFRVLHNNGRVFICAPHGRNTPGNGSYSFAEYFPKTGIVKSVRKPADVAQWKTIEQIKAHIKELTK